MFIRELKEDTQIVLSVYRTDFALPVFRRGKVRDVYKLGDRLLIVASDRISAFDCVLPNPIVGKGIVLNQMSLFWFNLFSDLVENHLVTADLDSYPEELAPYRQQLEGRSCLVRLTEPIPVECVARGYLAGSGWKDYRRTGSICGVELPAGLQESARLSEPIFTPATKAETGHDENISEARMADLLGLEMTRRLKDLTLEIYTRASKYALERGIIICDTKMEFGLLDDHILLIDELLTPDSSRFWPLESYCPGRSQPSFDKQSVRDYLETLDWNKQPPAPPLPEAVVDATQKKYLEAYRILTGQDLHL